MHCKTLYRTVALAHANKRRGVTPRGYTNAIATACANTPAAVCRAIAEAPLQVRQRDARRTDTRRSWCVCDDRVRMYAELSLQARFPKHGGLTPAAPGACAFVHRKSRNSVGGRTRANKSGGDVSPPWFVKPRFGRRFDSRSTPAVTTVVAATRLQGRPPTHRRQSSEQLR